MYDLGKFAFWTFFCENSIAIYTKRQSFDFLSKVFNLFVKISRYWILKACIIEKNFIH